MISIQQGDRLECFKIDNHFIGTLTLLNNYPSHHCGFKIRTNNTQDIQVLPYIGSFKGQNCKITVKCIKFQRNAKLQILVADINDQNFNKTDPKSLTQYFEANSSNPYVEKIKIEIVTIDQNLLIKQSSIINQSASQFRYYEDQMFVKQEVTYDQNGHLMRIGQVQQQQQQQQLIQESSQQSSRVLEGDEKQFITQPTFQIQCQTFSKQSSGSQNNIQNGQTQNQQAHSYEPQKQNGFKYEVKEDPQIKMLNQRIISLQNELEKSQIEKKSLEQQKLSLLNNYQEKDSQIFVSIQHVFFSAIFCFLLGYVATS
ncbi:unnamed protein product (macronuclear) [Paramecium tetraurelia]|uniref:MSP domain-containing protein n=1 Tax=Paramecium tetraurelia TaxID=5888 RepID=A0CH04_PARTE|nr:uncharacterized protein GSPATT00007511001 [Paramecium tetraurelia]CAK70071.1 unnamed protein product [Paramecium tetraurelia]|eukprot:XP_001437468.1 hypothetical protein (macronuclear) [Paramecium tetraurelia strain d4-2]